MKKYLLGNKYLQPLFEFLFKVAIKGMNYDRGHIAGLSGEKNAIGLARRFFPNKELIIFDVGANTGQYSTMVKECLSPPFQLYAFEPQRPAFEKLKSIMTGDNFHPCLIGLGSEPGKKVIHYDRDGSVWGSLYPASHESYKINLDKKTEIEISTVENFCSENGIGRIDFLKIDVEGYEIEVLKGCKGLIEDEKIGIIQFEFGVASIPARIFMRDFFELLKDYSIFRILQNGVRQITYSEKSELFFTTNYLAIHRKLLAEHEV